LHVAGPGDGVPRQAEPAGLTAEAGRRANRASLAPNGMDEIAIAAVHERARQVIRVSGS
jgi:hypothetical protein